MSGTSRPKPLSLAKSSAVPQANVSVGSDRITATLPNGDSVSVLLFGATVTNWTSGGKEKLWLSSAAKLDGSKPVRGGIPVVFPVFGPPPKNHATSNLPQHGFARNSTWLFLGSTTSESGLTEDAQSESVKLDFSLSSEQPQGKGDGRASDAWPFDFDLVYSVTLSKGRLQTTLDVHNRGDKNFEFQMLLHSYFHVDDISTTKISGLGSTTYIDKVLDATEHDQSDHFLAITGEVDRVYKSIKQDTTSILQQDRPHLDITRENLSDTVVWNPWIEKSKGMGDFEPKSGYKNMVCVEVGAVNGWQTLEPGETFQGGQIITDRSA